jgi:hypothetical protein
MAAPNNFLNTPAERHAFTIGLCELIAPTPPRWHIIGPDLMRTLNDEYHYYALGRATGTLAWFGIVLALLHTIF